MLFMLDAGLAKEEQVLRTLLGLKLIFGALKDTTVANKVATVRYSIVLQQKLDDMYEGTAAVDDVVCLHHRAS